MKRKCLFFILMVSVSISAFSWDPIGDITHPERILRNAEREARNAGKEVDRLRREVDANVGGEALRHWIIESRNDARRAGTNRIPRNIYNDLVGYFGVEALRGITYRAHRGHFLNLANSSFNLGDQSAITLDNVIVFRFEGDALNNSILWAHEVAHVQQYRKWGIRDFSIKYIRSYKSVENEAEEVEKDFARYLRRTASTRQPSRARTRLGSYCRIGRDGCPTNIMPIGTRCSCVDKFNRVYYGNVVQ